MIASKSLSARPSLESLRKQAKTLARDSAAGDAVAVARARAQLPRVDLPLSQRNAQLVLAREYGYAGWQDLTAEVRTIPRSANRSMAAWAAPPSSGTSSKGDRRTRPSSDCGRHSSWRRSGARSG